MTVKNIVVYQCTCYILRVIEHNYISTHTLHAACDFEEHGDISTHISYTSCDCEDDQSTDMLLDIYSLCN